MHGQDISHLSKNYHDVDCLNKLIKKHKEKEKESQKLKMKDEPIYNQLPVDYGLYEGIIEEMKLKELKNKIYIFIFSSFFIFNKY